MEPNYNLSGPDPSTLDTADHYPEGIQPMTLRVTYTSNSVDDYIALKRSGRQVALEFADPLLDVVRKAGKVSNLVGELRAALAAIGIDGILDHFTSRIAEYANAFLPVSAIPLTIGLSVAAYLLRKMYETNLLILGHIHQASIDELPNWLGLIESAKDHPDVNVS